jgi:MFS family permease
MSDINEPIFYCANHPDTPTTLRCNRCEKPICPKCAVLTPTGYRCNECVRNQQKIFDTALWYDYILAFLIGAILSYLGSLIVRFIGFFTIFLAPIAGVIIAEAIRAAVRRRRSKRLFQVATLAVALGSLPALMLLILGALAGGGFGGYLFPLIWQGLYMVTIISTVYYRLSGIRIGR